MQDYNTIIGSIQMRLNGCQTRSVMDRYKIGSGTLNLIMSRYHANGIPIEELRMMAPKEVENLFYPQKNLQRKDVPLPDFQYYYDRIHAPGSRMNISFCWLDYKEKNPDGYEKSQFYEYFNRFIAENYGGQKVSMAVNRIPGEKMYIDWVGDQPELLTDTETGEIKKVHIFATTLGVSSLRKPLRGNYHRPGSQPDDTRTPQRLRNFLLHPADFVRLLLRHVRFGHRFA